MFLCVIKDFKFNKINTKIVWTVVIQVSKTSTNIPSATFRIAAESSENGTRQNSANIYLLKVNNKSTRKGCEKCSK